MIIYNQNIWGNFSAEGQYVANRNAIIKDMIYGINPEFCCFQECNPNTSRSGDEAIQDILKPQYIETETESAFKNYTPLFYDCSRVKLINGGYFPFEGLNDLNSKSVSWGVFKELKSNKPISVISTHFWWKDESYDDEIQRRKNAETVFNITNDIIRQYNCAVIVCGDLNSGNTSQGSGGYDAMIEYGFEDVRFVADKTDKSFTCCTKYPEYKDGKYIGGEMPDQTIDYIFVHGKEKIESKEFAVVNTAQSRTSSDHLPLIFNFELK